MIYGISTNYLRFFPGVLLGVDLVAWRLFWGLDCSSVFSTDFTSVLTCFGVSFSFFGVSLPISWATREIGLVGLPLDLSWGKTWWSLHIKWKGLPSIFLSVSPQWASWSLSWASKTLSPRGWRGSPPPCRPRRWGRTWTWAYTRSPHCWSGRCSADCRVSQTPRPWQNVCWSLPGSTIDFM